MPTMRAIKTKLNLVPFSDKQQKLMTWWMPGISPHHDKDVIITDGAVRSGKTIIGGMSFIMWAMYTFNHQNFGIAGKSLGSLKRNLWVPLKQWFDDVEIKVIRLQDTNDGYILKYSYEEENGTIIEKENYFYLFGGRDARSSAYVQGFTAAGFTFDETTLMPVDFVNQAIARCSVEGSKIWFNCNPEGPFHWFKKEWVDKAESKNALRLQFRMHDNPSLSKKTLKRYKNQWTGVFYQRFVLGEWVMAEGSIYKVFIDHEREFYTKFKPYEGKVRNGIYIDGEFYKFGYLTIGVDWGGRTSGHAFCATAITSDFKYVVILKSEWHDAENTTPDDVMRWLMIFIKEIEKLYGEITEIYADSAEQLLVNLLKQKTSVPVRNSIKNPINDRIKFTIQMMAERRLLIVEEDCENVCDYFKVAMYDPKYQTEDRRLDDGSYDQDSGDSWEYSVERYIPYIIQDWSVE